MAMNNTCPNCGAETSAGAKFCAQCGRNLQSDEGRAGRQAAGAKLVLLLIAVGVFAWVFGRSQSGDGAAPAVEDLPAAMTTSGQAPAMMGGHGTAAITDPELKRLYDESQAAPDDLAKMRALAQAFEERLQNSPDQAGEMTMGAVEVLGRILKASPDDKDALLALGEISAANGVYDRAVGYYSRYLAAMPADNSARLRYASALIGAGQAAVARTELNALVEKEPGNFQVLLHLALAQAEDGDKAAALESVARAEKAAGSPAERTMAARLLEELRAEPAPAPGDQPPPFCPAETKNSKPSTAP